MSHPFSIYSLGDSALTISLDDSISESANDKVLAMQYWFKRHVFEGLLDIIPAYSSLTLVYDPVAVKRKYHPGGLVNAWVQELLEKAFRESESTLPDKGVLVDIPVCYDATMGMDLAAMARQKKLSVEAIIQLHTSVNYRVYMVGFLPGFPYLADVPPALVTPRKTRPVPVAPGSVGIAGSQTGIYPVGSPGGWNIIGRTPVKLFDPAAPAITKLKAGDIVHFYAISLAEFIERENVGGVVMW